MRDLKCATLIGKSAADRTLVGVESPSLGLIERILQFNADPRTQSSECEANGIRFQTEDRPIGVHHWGIGHQQNQARMNK